jgi:hypothetical protein
MKFVPAQIHTDCENKKRKKEKEKEKQKPLYHIFVSTLCGKGSNQNRSQP